MRCTVGQPDGSAAKGRISRNSRRGSYARGDGRQAVGAGELFVGRSRSLVCALRRWRGDAGGGWSGHRRMSDCVYVFGTCSDPATCDRSCARCQTRWHNSLSDSGAAGGAHDELVILRFFHFGSLRTGNPGAPAAPSSDPSTGNGWVETMSCVQLETMSGNLNSMPCPYILNGAVPPLCCGDPTSSVR